MAIYNINGSKMLTNNKIFVNINIPIDEFYIQNCMEDDFNNLNEIMLSQYYSSVKDAIETYQKSSLPDKFIQKQEFYIRECSSQDIYEYHRILGLYNSLYDLILFDPDAIIGLFNVSKEFLLGHEIGHKIYKYKADDLTKEEIASITDISQNDDYKIQETFADACGDLVNNRCCSFYQFVNLNSEKRNQLKNLVLRTSHKC